MNPDKLDRASDAKKPIASEAKNPDPLSVELVPSTLVDRRTLLKARRQRVRRQKESAEIPVENRVKQRRISQRRKQKRSFSSQPLRETTEPIDNGEQDS